MRISDWSSDVCSSDLAGGAPRGQGRVRRRACPAGALPGGAAPYRDADLPRRPRQRRAPLRARLFFAATPSEGDRRWEEHTSELQYLMRTSYDVSGLKKIKVTTKINSKKYTDTSRPTK